MIDGQKFGIFVLLLLGANFITNLVNQYLPSQEGLFGWFLGIVIPAAILWLLLKQWGKEAGVKLS